MDKDGLLLKIGHKIKEIRLSKNISQQELAYRCDIEGSNMARIEAGRTNITMKTLYKISRALGVKMSDAVNVE